MCLDRECAHDTARRHAATTSRYRQRARVLMIASDSGVNTTEHNESIDQAYPKVGVCQVNSREEHLAFTDEHILQRDDARI